MSTKSQLKGIAVRVHEDVLEKMEAQKLPRSELIELALVKYFEEKKKTTSDDAHSEDIPDDLYEEVYNEIYNLEVVPLKQRIQYQQEMTMLMQDRIMDLEEDKKFLQRQAEQLACFANAHKPFSFRRNKLEKESDKQSGVVEEEL